MPKMAYTFTEAKMVSGEAQSEMKDMKISCYETPGAQKTNLPGHITRASMRTAMMTGLPRLSMHYT